MNMITKNHDQLTIEVEKHIESGSIAQGAYWNGSRGCFIGCLTHSNDVSVLGDRFGLPAPLVLICENIFEALTPDGAKAFFAAIPAAVGCDGKDLTRVHWALLASELQALPKAIGVIKHVVDPVIEGMLLLASGEEWPEAAAAAAAASAARVLGAEARAAYEAARAAYEAAGVELTEVAEYAVYATYAAARITRATYDTARVRQCHTVLRLIEKAPVTMASSS